MRSTVSRVVAGGPGRRIYRGAKLIIRKRVQLLVTALVLSLLVASLPVSGRTQGLSSPRRTASVQWTVYGSLKQTLASLGGWLSSHLTVKPASNSYQPVTAYYTPPPPFIDAPTNLTVTATSNTTINLSWTAAGGADHYEVERSDTISGPFLFIGTTSGTTYQDASVTTLHAYLYRLRAVTSGGLPSVPSNMALGTATAFEFSSLSGKDVKKQHFYDVRNATNAVRAVANLAAASWTPRVDLTGLEVKADDVQQIRNALDEALGLLSIPVTAYTDATLATGANGTLIKAVHIEQLQTRSTRGQSTSPGPLAPDSSNARLDPMNGTGGGGENPLSRNFNWNLPLVSLPGRSGLNMGLTLSYNSLVWTRIGANSISFDDDNGFPGPGFRIGFPVIQLPYHNAEVQKNAFLLIGSDGSRTELRQVGDDPLYEAGDSTHLLLNSDTMVLRTTDGTQLTYALYGGEYKCTQIKDRNGNYITVSYNVAGQINTITDTLARVITFNYDGNGWLTSITQVWEPNANPTVTHYWARFEYSNTQIDTNFPGKTVFGPVDGMNVKNLSRVKLADDSYFDFSYTSWGQVFKVRSYAPNNDLLSYRRYNLPEAAGTGHDDCPRFTERYDWARYWNGDTEGTSATSEEALTQYAVPASASWTMPGASSTVSGMRAQVTTPDGTSNKIYFLGEYGWQRGLPALVDTYSSGGTDPVRRSRTTWTQDNTSASYLLNPRVTETNTYDDANNRARTEIVYEEFEFSNETSCHLPQVVKEYAADASTVLRSRKTVYNMDANYTDLRILGLVSDQFLYEGEVNIGPLRSKVAFVYDGSGSILGNDTPVQHATSYNSSFLFRGNLSSVKRYDVDVANLDVFTTTSRKYNTAGSVVSSTDAASHTIAISYTDSFSDGVSRTTLAYPTKVTDPDNFFSTSQYNFDFGAVTRQQTPRPNSTDPNDADPRPAQSSTFDSIGRLQQITNLVTNAYTRFEYSTNGIRVDVYATIKDIDTETHSFKFTDGVGRVIGSATDHNTNTFNGQRIVYDVMGRVIKKSNPTETSASGSPLGWNTTGDDQNTGWVYTEQTYDWKSRPLVITNPSLTSNPADTTTKQYSYSGCGCAGGQVVTVTDEGNLQGEDVVKTRQQKIYSDVLGRTIKTEIMDWDGTGPNGIGRAVYSATTFTHNARDQITLVRQFAGSTSSATFQDTTSTYDGFGRLKTQHLPEQVADTSYTASTDHTTRNYNDDDSIASVVDARGVVTSYTYNARRLPTLIEFDSSAIPTAKNVPSTADISFAYDGAGNRTSMSDGSGTVSYHYDQSSRMDWEERTFAALPNAGAFRLVYEYSIGGMPKKVTDQHAGTSFTETLDKLGRVTAVDAVAPGATTQFISNAQYRAWGALKSRTQAGNTLSLTYNAGLLPKSYTLASVQRAYDYNNDGSLKFADDQSGSFDIKDRGYSYDVAGRMEHGYSGVEARNFVNNTTGGTPDGPYKHQYFYDHWGNMLADSGRFWSRTVNTSDNYGVNNRVSAWSYDAEGNVLSRNELATTVSPFVPAKYTFDAAGRQVGSTQTRSYMIENLGKEISEFVNSQTFDGDNRMTHYAMVRNVSYGNPQLPSGSETTAEAYLLRSTVLGGSVISEYKADGAWFKTYAYAGEERLGEHASWPAGTQSFWETYDPVTGDRLKTIFNGAVLESTTLDPMGVDVGSEDPFPPDGGGGEGGALGGIGKVVPFITPIEGGGATCILDGLEIECGRISGNASVQCPNNDCGPKRVVYQGEPVWAFFQGYADGYSGYVPSTARYIGNGGLAPANSGGTPRLGSGGNHRRRDTDLNRLNGGRGPEDDLRYDYADGIRFLSSPQEFPRGTREEWKQAIRDAVADAEKRILNNPACATLFAIPLLSSDDDTEDNFGHSEQELPTVEQARNYAASLLRNTTYRVLPLGVPTVRNGRIGVIGAATMAWDTVFINQDGPIFNYDISVPGYATTRLDFGTGLGQTQFAALLLLHELGHQAGLFGPDVDDPVLNRSYTQTILDACFPELARAQP